MAVLSWQKLRRAGQEALNEISRDVVYFTTLSKEAVLLADGLLRDNKNWEGELHR